MSHKTESRRATIVRQAARRLSVLPVLLALAAFPALAESFLYTANAGGNDVSVIDTNTNTVVATIPVGTNPLGIAITPDGTRAYVANALDNTVSVINTATNTVVATVPVGVFPVGVAITPGGTRAYVANNGSNTVSVIDTSTNTVIVTVPVSRPYLMAITPDGTRVYVSDLTSAKVSVIDTSSNTVVATVTVGASPEAVAITPNGTRAYVTNAGSGTVSVIDTATNTVVATVPVGTAPGGAAITPNGARAYVSNFVSANVFVIDTATNTAVATVPVGGDPHGVAIIPDGTRAYVANFSGDSVSVINTATNTVLATVPLPLGSAPFGVALKSVAADVFQVGYAANLTSGSSIVNLTNAGTNGGNDKTDFICANVYVFAQDQQLISCCACPMSPNDLQTLSVQNDLINNTLTPGKPTAVTIALLATDDTGPATCDAGNPGTHFVSGLRAWGTTLHAAPSGGFAVTETKFSQVPLGITSGGSEYVKLTGFCSFIEADGSGNGICNACRSGAQGAQKAR